MRISDWSSDVCSSDLNADYLSAFTPEQIAYFQGFPLWANIGWAFGVWGSVLGSILLLARSRHAVTAFAVSLLGLAISSLYQFGLHWGDLQRMFGNFPAIFAALIWIVAIALLIYSRRQVEAGVKTGRAHVRTTVKQAHS